MAGLVEVSQWEDEIYQLETTDPVEGGPNGIDNKQAKQLANRTQFLKDKFDVTKNPNPLPQYPLSKNAQFQLYDPTRSYVVGDVCYTKDDATGAKAFWEWYSNVESLVGKDPLDPLNRQTGWTDETKPFYWTPFKKSRSGSTQWPWMSMTFPEGTLNVLGNSVPTAVFWRLAEALPEFVNAGTGMIDFPETGGEFFRILDQGRGVDSGRTFGSSQIDQIKTSGFLVRNDAGGSPLVSSSFGDCSISDAIGAITVSGEGIGQPQQSVTIGNGTDTHPKNLAFPILVEV
ncbi:hypothetical protein [Vibrio diazotrophicus]|uniref:Tail fiber protein n=1 Tax=Vibrio diazotrophicus TaxID=685 RepID=A0ABX4W8U4_VIBDI|nr:hypothetical protein [Vibrio diazotrophicus]PNH99230.1 hypothetical protein C1O25_17920 [Vibrio diazotrophicus]